jgi:lysophospholipase L1-like esterase
MMRVLLAFFLAAVAFAQSGFHLKNGDVVVFYGDSITDQRLYTTFAETYAVTRFPQQNVTFIHKGWGGDRVTGGGGGNIETRLRRDVIPYKPTVITIMLGMNDGRYRAFDQATFDEYASGMRNIVSTLKQTLPNARITLIEPSPYDDVTRPPTFSGGYNAVLVRYGQYLRELADKERLGTADLNTSVVASLKRASESDAGLAQKISPDRVHPGPAGHLLMAAALLRAWNAPAVVSAVEIDGAKATVIRGENAEVSALSRAAEGLTWTQVDRALPLPVNMTDPVIALAVRSSDIERSLNWQPLKVTGLTAGRYGLRIDGQSAGSFTGEQLAAGVNLAMLSTPMAKQAADVHALTLKHNAVHFTRWRTIEVPLERDQLTKARPAMEALDEVEKEIVARQRELAKPTPHRFELVREP